MSQKEMLIALRSALVDLFPETNDVRSVAQDADLNRGRIDFNGRIVNVWRSVLEEAEKSNKLGAVVQAALTEYPAHPVLRQAAQLFGANEAATGASLAPPGNTPVIHQTTHINTGGGPYIAGNVDTRGDFIGRDQTTGATPSKPV
jgi:hypothetical protein